MLMILSRTETESGIWCSNEGTRLVIRVHPASDKQCDSGHVTFVLICRKGVFPFYLPEGEESEPMGRFGCGPVPPLFQHRFPLLECKLEGDRIFSESPVSDPVVVCVSNNNSKNLPAESCWRNHGGRQGRWAPPASELMV